MLEASTRARVSCPENFQFTGYIEGCRAFALEENGLYAEAERAGRVAVQREPRDIWGRHAVAHVLEMTGRPHEGIRWLADERTWEHANNFRFHIIWHLALFHLDQGDSAEVLRLYDEEIQTGATQDFRDLANSASLLARLEFDGIHVGERWEILGEIARSRIADRRLVFADLHYVLALLGAGRRDSAELIASGLLQDVERGDDAERGASAVPGASTAKGLLAYHAGNYDDAARQLGLARSGLQTIGGSHAQRDVFEQAYIESLLRSGAHDLAISVLCERLARRGGVNGYASRRLASLRVPALSPALPAAP